MTTDFASSDKSGSVLPPRVFTACAVFLLVIYVSMALSSAAKKSSTFDEIAHITRGYVYWKYNDYRFQDNGNLPNRLAALPVVMGDFRFPPLDNRAWRESKIGTIGKEFSFHCGNNFQSMIFRGRLVIILVGCLAGLAIWLWSRKLFGEVGGLLSLAVFAVSPSMIANGRCITSDMTVALMFLLSVWAIWTALHKLTPLTLSLSCLATGGLFVSKMSAFVMLPMVVVLVIVNLLCGQPLVLKWRRTVEVLSTAKKAVIIFSMIVAHVLVTMLVIWTFFGFRFEAFRVGRGPGEQFPGGSANLLKVNSAAGATIEFCREHRLLPESYLYSMSHVLRRSEQRENYFFGKVSSRGSVWFFPYTYFAKMPEGTLALIILALVTAILRFNKSSGNAAEDPKTKRWSGLYSTAPLWALIVVYWVFAIFGDMNIGHRHILPACLPVFVLAGAAGAWFSRPGRVMKIVILISLAGSFVSCLCIWPHHLSYFNLISGGPENARQRVVDSSLDWGQDLPALRKFLADQSEKDTKVYLTYFGTAEPAAYGITARRLGGFGWLSGHPATRLPPLHPGIYCISVTLLQGAYFPESVWNEDKEKEYRELAEQYDLGDDETPVEILARSPERFRFALLRLGRLTAFLRHRAPEGRAGYSIHIYHLTAEDIKSALQNPVP